MRTMRCLAVAALLGLSGSARADMYESYTFTGQISPGNANVQAPFTADLTQGEKISGSFINDTSLQSAAGPGFFDVNFSAYPDRTSIPDSSIFQIKLGGIVLDQGAAFPGTGAVQYNNGAFNGFDYTGDFAYMGGNYELVIAGGTFSIDALVAGVPTGNNLVNGTINIGNANLTDGGAFTPVSNSTPEPSSLVLVGIGFAGAVVAFRRKQARAVPKLTVQP